MVNAKVITKGERVVISCGAHYWKDKTARLTPDQAAQVRDKVGAQRNRVKGSSDDIYTLRERGGGTTCIWGAQGHSEDQDAAN